MLRYTIIFFTAALLVILGLFTWFLLASVCGSNEGDRVSDVIIDSAAKILPNK